jgi:hypothetical protein
VALALLGCGEPELEPTFANVRAEVLGGSCAFSSCHGVSTGELKLDGSQDDHARLVDAPSAAAVGEVLVVPGDPDASYLLKKLEGADDVVGDPMPPSGELLDAARIDLVRRWIEAGAPAQ